MKNIFNIDKKLSRKGYWKYQGILLIIGVALECISQFLFKNTLLENNYLNYFMINDELNTFYFLRIGFFAMIIIGFYFQSRRFVDIGWSKYWSLLSLLPVIGIVTTGICLFKKGNDNKKDSNQ